MSSLKLWSPAAVAPVAAMPVRIRSCLLFALVAGSACTDPLVSSHERHGTAYVLVPSDYGSLVGATISDGRLLSPAGVVLGPVREIPTSPDSALTVPLVSPVPDEPTTAAYDQPPLCWYIVWYDRWGRVIHEELLWCDDWGLGPGTDTVSVEISCGEGDGEAGTESAERGDPVGCSIELDQGELEWVEWTFTGDSIGERTKKLTGEQGFVWPGKAVESVEVEATLRIVLGPELTKEVDAPSVDLAVTERGWAWSDAMIVGWNNDADACLGWEGGPGGLYLGWTQAVGCGPWFDSTANAFSVAGGEGPWQPLNYIDSPNAPVHWEALLRPDLLDGGPKYPLVDTLDPSGLVEGCREFFGDTITRISVFDANTRCDTVPDYPVVILLVIAHENRHLAIGPREVAEHDIYGKWDAFYDGDAQDLKDRALRIARAAFKEMQDAHDALDASTGSPREIWMYHKRHKRWAKTVVYPH